MRPISFVVLLVTVAGIGFYLDRHREIYDRLRGIPAWSVVPLFFLGVLTLAANGLYLRIIARKFGLSLLAREWFGLATVTAMWNYLTPLSGGLVARAAYLKRRYDFPYTHFLAMLAANYVIAFAVISVTGVVIMLTLSGTENYSWLVLFFFMAVLLTVLLVSFFPSITTGNKNRLLSMAQGALECLSIIRRDRVLLGKLVVLTFFNITIGALLFFVVFGSLGSAIPFRTALLIYLITSFTALFIVTPGNLGVQEAVTSFAAAILGAGADMGLLASLIIRAVTILTAFALGPYFSYLLSKELIAANGVAQVERKECP